MTRFLAMGLGCALAVCTAANATPIGPTDDLHCFVIASYFHAFAETSGAPAKQLHASRVIGAWYAGKLREAGVDPAKRDFRSRADPILDAVTADPLAARAPMVACTDRAVADPAFNRFARALASAY
jgi:hypothetical protein